MDNKLIDGKVLTGRLLGEYFWSKYRHDFERARQAGKIKARLERMKRRRV